MAKVTVVYNNLHSSAIILENLKDGYITTATKSLGKIDDNLSSLGSKHDDCFSNAIDVVTDLERAFANYEEEVGFMQQQCKNACEVFKDAEEKTKELTTDNMKNFVAGLSAMIGGSQGNFDLDFHTNGDNIGKNNYQKATATQTSSTWNNTFEIDKDGYVKTNAKVVPNSNSIVSEDEKDNTTETKKNPIVEAISAGAGLVVETAKGAVENYGNIQTSSRGSNSNGGYSSGGGSGSSGGISSKVKYKEYTDNTTKKVDNSNKTTDKKEETTKDPVKEVTPTNNTTTNTETNNNNNSTSTESSNSTSNNTTTSTPSTASTNQTVYHTGGGYSSNEGFTPYSEGETTNVTSNQTENTTEGVILADDLEEDISGEIDTIIKGDEVTKIPVSSDPITTKKSSGSSAIPIAAGLSAASAAGLGAKAYMDHKNNNSEDEEDEFDTEWDGDESTDIDYGDSKEKEETLEEDYISNSSPVSTPYGARTNEELTDI